MSLTSHLHFKKRLQRSHQANNISSTGSISNSPADDSRGSLGENTGAAASCGSISGCVSALKLHDDSFGSFVANATSMSAASHVSATAEQDKSKHMVRKNS